MPENRTPDELVELAREIRRRVEERLRASSSAEEAGIEVEADSLSSVSRKVPDRGAPVPGTAPRSDGSAAADNFWDLGQPKPRIYERASFSGRTLAPADINVPDPDPAPDEHPAEAERIVRDGRSFTGEPIRPREVYQGSAGRVIRTASGQRSVPGSSGISTRSYRRPAPRTGAADRIAPAPKSPGSAVVKTYRPEGTLIREITVRTWETDTEFYNRFLTDALRSHGKKYAADPGTPVEPVPYFSYVPQYSHMSLKQVTYYEYVRECVRRGRFPVCDFPYVLLYVYEILNLPDAIVPEEGARLLTAVWIGYRKLYPRLDGYLCEWLPDYCMIHGVPLPEEVYPILPEIVPKAQFKEFFMNRIEGELFAGTMIETASDYDFRTGRYYAENREAYERHIPAAVSAAFAAEAAARAGIFALDRVYKMTRDSFCGAIVASSVKRRLDIEFTSFTRRADARTLVTGLVKHAENRLRAVLGIKAKLGVNGITEEDIRAIDAYFAPLLPTREQIRQKKEDAYMPADYLKHYESEDTGFDPDAAAAIEARSWANTTRLTGEDYGGADPAPGPEDEGIPPFDSDGAEVPTVDGEMTGDFPAPQEPVPPQNGLPEDEPTEPAEVPQATDAEPDGETEEDPTLRAALRAALDGGFRAFCRERGFYEGEIADRLNNRFLECMGDVILEAEGNGFRLIEEYREDAEEWLR